jgi:S1-C subfamily serine protease
VDLQGLGSGVVISEAGFVLTAAHVVQTADQIVSVAMARLSTGDLLTVKVLRGGKVIQLVSRIPSPDRR